MKKTNKGFTLVELIIVIAILAIIMLIAIPNFSGIQQRMKVRADKSTAAQIGKAVRVWYTDYTTDKTLNDKLSTTEGEEDKEFMEGKQLVDYTGLTGIEDYAAKTYKPTSLLTAGKVAEANQYYLVGLTTITNDAKICVSISNVNTVTAVGDTPSVSYDGSAPAIAYIEP